MAPAAVDSALAEAVLVARQAEKDAKRQRARAMDEVVDLLLERARLRRLLAECLPYMWVVAANSRSIVGEAMMPKDICRAAEEMGIKSA